MMSRHKREANLKREIKNGANSMRNFNTGINAPLAGTSRRSATLRHRELTKYCECDAQIVSDFCTDKTCGNLQFREDIYSFKSTISISFETFKVNWICTCLNLGIFNVLIGRSVLRECLGFLFCSHLKGVDINDP